MSTGLLGFESVEQRQGGVGNYLSPSRLNCWLRCPLAFRLTYIDGIRQPTTPSLFLGRIVHMPWKRSIAIANWASSLEPTRLPGDWSKAGGRPWTKRA